MDKHTEKCIRYFEAMADHYHMEAKKYEGLRREDGPGSYYFLSWQMAKAQEDAYRDCARALKDKGAWL